MLYNRGRRFESLLGQHVVLISYYTCNLQVDVLMLLTNFFLWNGPFVINYMFQFFSLDLKYFTENSISILMDSALTAQGGL